MAIGKDFFDFQEKLGYKFSSIELLQTAFTHTSYSNEQRLKGNSFPSNERLEFLGDAVLQIIISQYLFTNYKSHSEGSLTKMRQYLVCEETLAKIAAEMQIGQYINLGKGEELADCRHRPKVLADTFESLIGAIFSDTAFDTKKTEEVVLKFFESALSSASPKSIGDYKTLLQQIVEKDGSAILEYEIIDQIGPEHNKTFTVVAKINNNIVGKGVAKSIKGAQMNAAKEALCLFGVTV